MTAAVTNDGLLALSDLLGVQTLPFVLGIGPQQSTVDAWEAARADALTELRRSGLLDQHGDVAIDLADALRILAQPDCELAARIYTESGVLRLCLVRRGTQHAVATRTGDTLKVGTTWADSNGTTLVRPLLDLLGPCPAASVPTISAPVHELRQCLDEADGSSDYTRIFHGLGVDERDATEFGLALSSCRAHAEIVAVAYDGGVTTRAPGAVAVYDTSRGRIVASPGTAPDRQVWSTFGSGTDHRIAQAVAALTESLPGGRWMP